jgi:hypothetical protein
VVDGLFSFPESCLQDDQQSAIICSFSFLPYVQPIQRLRLKLVRFEQNVGSVMFVFVLDYLATLFREPVVLATYTITESGRRLVGIGRHWST